MSIYISNTMRNNPRSTRLIQFFIFGAIRQKCYMPRTLKQPLPSVAYLLPNNFLKPLSLNSLILFEMSNYDSIPLK